MDSSLGFKHGVKDATNDVKRISRTWFKYPDAAIGFAIPPDIIVIDCDVRKDSSKRPLLKNGQPDMNDVIEGAVSYTAKMIEKDLKQYKFFFRYTQGLSIRNPNLSKPIMNHKDKGRMAFRMSENVKFSIDRIRNVKSFENSEDPNMDLLKGISDAILVRSCIYYLLESPFLLDFLLIMYLSTLFDVSVPSINFRSKSIEEEVSYMTEEAKENLRMILWDEPIILSLTNPNGVADPKNDLTTEYLMRSFSQSKKKMVLNTTELATIFHFPDQKNIPTSQLSRQASKQVDGPRDMPDDGLLLGHNSQGSISKKTFISWAHNALVVRIV